MQFIRTETELNIETYIRHLVVLPNLYSDMDIILS
jgi:hypothetical protein